jgi:hypothetical protein
MTTTTTMMTMKMIRVSRRSPRQSVSLLLLVAIATITVTTTTAFTVTPTSSLSLGGFGVKRVVSNRMNTAVWGSKSSSSSSSSKSSADADSLSGESTAATHTTKESTTMDASSISSSTAASKSKNGKKPKTLGPITFDLDDTLYPIAPVIEEANRAFARSMESFGYGSIEPQDIVDTGKAIREEIAVDSPDRAAVLTHTEIRQLAIRREMERITLTRKLKACADDWATPVSSLSPIVVQHAKK